MRSDTLKQRVDRAKARWLKRVMYGSRVTSTQKVLAYAIADHLNCVTLDCWPKQTTLVSLLCRVSVKTVQRAGGGLQAKNLIRIRRDPVTPDRLRYSPIFNEGEWNEIVGETGRMRPSTQDRNVLQSILSTRLISSSTALTEESAAYRRFDRSKRGALELELAEKLGAAGFEILDRLARIDDSIVDRLCRALAANELGERELSAARLAAEHAGKRL